MMANGDGLAAAAGGLGLLFIFIIATFCMFLLILSILLPFFVWGIYNRVAQQNAYLYKLLKFIEYKYPEEYYNSQMTKKATKQKKAVNSPKKGTTITKQPPAEPNLLECTHCGHVAEDVEFASSTGQRCPVCQGV